MSLTNDIRDIQEACRNLHKHLIVSLVQCTKYCIDPTQFLFYLLHRYVLETNNLTHKNHLTSFSSSIQNTTCRIETA